MYNKSIPQYLHNRPRRFVEHCRDKLSIAKVLDVEKAKIKKSLDNQYEVQSFENDQSYIVDLSKPSCECFSWKRSKLPCKHMFSLILHTEETWDSFQESYRNSIYVSLDESVVGKITHSLSNSTTTYNYMNEPDEDAPNFVEEDRLPDHPTIDLPEKIRIARSKLGECREHLKEMISLTYCINDENVSKELLFEVNGQIALK